MSLLRIRTIFECGDHRNKCGIKHIAVIIDTCRIDVQHPHSAFGLYAQR